MRTPDTPARGLPPLLWLKAADVLAALPPLEERLRLAELTMTALATPGGSQLPPKVGVEPRPEGAFTDAMPAWLRGGGAGAEHDLLGVKWVTVFPGNQALGLPAIGATVVLNDPSTGVPVAILDGGPLTAHRTAAVTGAVLRRWSPSVESRAVRVGLIGAGAQGRSHLGILGGVLTGCELTINDVDPGRAADLAGEARRTAGIGAVEVAADPRSAVRDADVVVTAASFGPVRQVMTPDWLKETVTVVPVDYATYCSAELVRSAALWMVDERVQFLAKRDERHFDGYPDPEVTIGRAILEGTARPQGRVIVTHLGVGLADLIFGDAVLREARRLGLGTPLPR
jgi:ornithine cyclodeaminase/alanine dehydrogenase-like protein (mu-crystallin family)